MTGYVYDSESLARGKTIYKVFLKIEDFGDLQKEDRKKTAQYAYTHLEQNNLLFTIRDEIQNPNKNGQINQQDEAISRFLSIILMKNMLRMVIQSGGVSA